MYFTKIISKLMNQTTDTHDFMQKKKENLGKE